jgi:hypothetical protein
MRVVDEGLRVVNTGEGEYLRYGVNVLRVAEIHYIHTATNLFLGAESELYIYCAAVELWSRLTPQRRASLWL